MTGAVWSIFLILSLCKICILVFVFQHVVSNFLCSQKVFCKWWIMLQSFLNEISTVQFPETDIYCRVSYSCGTIDEIKRSPFSPVFLFMLSTVERRVFYFCSLFLYFFKLVFKHSGISFKQEEHSQTQPLKRSLDKRVGGILMPGKARAFLYLTYLLFFYLKCYCYFYHTKTEAETLEEEHQCLPRNSSLSRIAKVL